MDMKKKAVLFTLISLLLASMFIALFSAQYQYNLEDRASASNTRVKVMDTYVKNFETYVDDSLQISSYKTLDALYSYIVGRNSFFSDSAEFNNTFYNCLACGYLNCTTKATSCPAPIAGNDLGTMLSNITMLANQTLNIATDYTINSVSVYQVRPFEVEVDLDISYEVSDISSSDYAEWNIRKIIHQTISIQNLYDPLTALNTKNNYRKIIKPTNICADATVNDTCWNMNNTILFYNSQEYRQYYNGTNYLNRFWNKTVSSGYSGIESFLNVSYVSGNNTYVDTYYWNGKYSCPSSNITILEFNFVNPGFRLDAYTAGRYNITDYGKIVCPTLPP
jgi:hypothetical protein